MHIMDAGEGTATYVMHSLMPLCVEDKLSPGAQDPSSISSATRSFTEVLSNSMPQAGLAFHHLFDCFPNHSQ